MRFITRLPCSARATLGSASATVTISPTEGGSTLMSISGADAWGKSYILAAEATWMEINTKTKARTPITATDSITVEASKK